MEESKPKRQPTPPPAPDESARTFIAQLDQAIKSGRKTEIEAFIVPGELTSFVGGIVGSQPEVWTTRVVRTEQLGRQPLWRRMCRLTRASLGATLREQPS